MADIAGDRICIFGSSSYRITAAYTYIDIDIQGSLEDLIRLGGSPYLFKFQPDLLIPRPVLQEWFIKLDCYQRTIDNKFHLLIRCTPGRIL